MPDKVIEAKAERVEPENVGVVSEEYFRRVVTKRLTGLPFKPGFVTGPGRSGAIAAVYASHILGVPFVPYGQRCPLSNPMVIDTAMRTGATIRKAARRYLVNDDRRIVVLFDEPPIVRFWYERIIHIPEEQ